MLIIDFSIIKHLFILIFVFQKIDYSFRNLCYTFVLICAISSSNLNIVYVSVCGDILLESDWN